MGEPEYLLVRQVVLLCVSSEFCFCTSVSTGISVQPYSLQLSSIFISLLLILLFVHLGYYPLLFSIISNNIFELMVYVTLFLSLYLVFKWVVFLIFKYSCIQFFAFISVLFVLALSFGAILTELCSFSKTVMQIIQETLTLTHCNFFSVSMSCFLQNEVLWW